MTVKYITISDISEQSKETFRSRVQRNNDNACWLWLGRTDKDGYGTFHFKKKRTRAHRIAYFLEYDNDPGELCVCHTCDNPLCINPKHLWLGTQAENSKDRNQKNRQARGAKSGVRLHPESVLRGSASHNSTLTELQVEEIRKRYKSENLTLVKLARQYNVTDSNISMIVKRKSWKHVL